ncbi:MAG: hypothetical protein ACSLE1_00125 [Sphingobium sp.]
MELFTKDNDSLMTVEKMSRDGSNLLIEGQIMGTLPVRAVLTPDQARAALKLLKPSTVWFLLTILFRSGKK